MKRLHLIVFMLVSMVVAAPLAQAQSTSELEIHATTVAFPQVTIQFSVHDATGRRVVGLGQSNIRLVEDGNPIPQFALDSQIADTATPVQQVALSDGSTYSLAATGATIGLVFDATQLLNGSGAKARDNLSVARLAIEAFLLESGDPPPVRTLAPGNLEQVGLFIPVDQPSQTLQPDGATGFTQDRYALINALRGLQPRQGKTNLYAGVQAAIDATARQAEQMGTEAVVLVVSDGGDAISGDTFNALITQATQRKVHIVAFGIGSDAALKSGGFRLKQLADGTGGVYLERPNAADAGAAFAQLAKPTPSAMYSLHYTTALIDDGKAHSVALQVNLPSGTVNYQFNLDTMHTAPPTTLQPLNDILMRQYVVIALPVALLLSLFLALITGFLRPGATGLNNGKTLKR
jgi:hypothetical protein